MFCPQEHEKFPLVTSQKEMMSLLKAFVSEKRKRTYWRSVMETSRPVWINQMFWLTLA